MSCMNVYLKRYLKDWLSQDLAKLQSSWKYNLVFDYNQFRKKKGKYVRRFSINLVKNNLKMA